MWFLAALAVGGLGVVALTVLGGGRAGRSVVVAGAPATPAEVTAPDRLADTSAAAAAGTLPAPPLAGTVGATVPASRTAAAAGSSTAGLPRGAGAGAGRPTASRTVRTATVTGYEAESATNGLFGTRTFACTGCSGGRKVGDIGRGKGTLRFNGIAAAGDAAAAVALSYVNGEATRTALLSVDGGRPLAVDFPGTGGWSTVGVRTLTVTLHAGANTLTVTNPDGPAPDFDRVTVTVPAP